MKKLLIWTVLLGVIGYGGAKLYLHNKVSSNVDKVIALMSAFADVEYKGVSSTISGELTVDGIRVRLDNYKDDIYIESMGVDTPHFLALLNMADMANGRTNPSDSIPKHLGFIAEGIRIPANADYYAELYGVGIKQLGVLDAAEAGPECTGKYGLSPTALQGMGYREQIMSFAMSVEQQSDQYVMKLTSDVKDMWQLDVDLALSGSMTAGLMRGSSYRPKLSNFRVEYTDDSLNERSRQYCLRRGLSEEGILAARLAAFDFTGESLGVVWDDALIDPYKEFLGGKSTYLMTAQPSQPVGIAQFDLYKASDIPALLNLSAEAQ